MIEYTAKRSLAAGHASGSRYTLDIEFQSADQQVIDVKDMERSLGGARETVLDRQDTFWTIRTEPVNGYRLECLREFLDSTESGETFRVWLYSGDAAPLLLKRIETGHTESAFMRCGARDKDFFYGQFTALQVAPYDVAGAGATSGGYVDGDDDSSDIYEDDPTGGLDPDPLSPIPDSIIVYLVGTHTYVKHPDLTGLEVICIAAGSGGASGYRAGSGGTNRTSGAGGAGGAWSRRVFEGPEELALVPSIVEVTVGAGGAGGAGVSSITLGSPGEIPSNPGAPGGDSSFGDLLSAGGGGAQGAGPVGNYSIGGAGGDTVGSEDGGGAGGSGGSAWESLGSWAVRNASSPILGASGGGGGGAGLDQNGDPYDSNGAAGNGGISAFGSASQKAGGAGGGHAYDDGEDGLSQEYPYEYPGSGGGGGGGQRAAFGETPPEDLNVGDGGDGGFPGGGGGGGGAGMRSDYYDIHPASTGSGGDGADGVVIVKQYFD